MLKSQSTLLERVNQSLVKMQQSMQYFQRDKENEKQQQATQRLFEIEEQEEEGLNTIGKRKTKKLKLCIDANYDGIQKWDEKQKQNLEEDTYRKGLRKWRAIKQIQAENEKPSRKECQSQEEKKQSGRCIPELKRLLKTLQQSESPKNSKPPKKEQIFKKQLFNFDLAVNQKLEPRKSKKYSPAASKNAKTVDVIKSYPGQKSYSRIKRSRISLRSLKQLNIPDKQESFQNIVRRNHLTKIEISMNRSRAPTYTNYVSFGFHNNMGHKYKVLAP